MAAQGAQQNVLCVPTRSAHLHRPHLENQFLLHISRHPASGKMLLQCAEGNSVDNVQSLGLTPQNYVPDTTRLGQGDSWEGESKARPVPVPNS